MAHHFMSIMMAKIQKLTKQIAGENSKQQATLKDSLAVLTNLNIILSCDPGITLLDNCLTDLKMYVHTKPRMRMQLYS